MPKRRWQRMFLSHLAVSENGLYTVGPKWGFPYMEVPLNPFLDGSSPDKPSSYWSTSIDGKTQIAMFLMTNGFIGIHNMFQETHKGTWWLTSGFRGYQIFRHTHLKRPKPVEFYWMVDRHFDQDSRLRRSEKKLPEWILPWDADCRSEFCLTGPQPFIIPPKKKHENHPDEFRDACHILDGCFPQFSQFLIPWRIHVWYTVYICWHDWGFCWW